MSWQIVTSGWVLLVCPWRCACAAQMTVASCSARAWEDAGVGTSRRETRRRAAVSVDAASEKKETERLDGTRLRRPLNAVDAAEDRMDMGEGEMAGRSAWEMMVCVYCVKGRYSVSSIACRWARSVGAGGRAKQQSGGVVVHGIFDSELGERVGGRSGPIIPLWAFTLTVMSSFWALIPGTPACLICRATGLW
jgi:hypothetical protein